jgi:hypothetical protein
MPVVSGPPGPMRPTTNNPKFNVLLIYVMGALVATFSLVTLAPGYWRLLAIPSGLLCVFLALAAIRAGRAAEQRQLDED